MVLILIGCISLGLYYFKQYKRKLFIKNKSYDDYLLVSNQWKTLMNRTSNKINTKNLDRLDVWVRRSYKKYLDVE